MPKIFLETFSFDNVATHYGRTILHYAAACGNLSAIRYIYETQKLHDFNVKDHLQLTLLHYACFFGRIDIVKYLSGISKEKGIDFNDIGIMGVTPLHFASEEGHFDVVKYLLENAVELKIDVFGKKINEGCTAEDLAKRNRHQDIIQLFDDYMTHKSPRTRRWAFKKRAIKFLDDN